MRLDRIHIVKKRAFLARILAAIAVIIALVACDKQKVHLETEMNYYLLEFENTSREDTYMISACKDDVFVVNFEIYNGYADLIIAMDGKSPIYRGNDIKTGAFEVIVPETGEYRITVNAKHVSGFIEVYAKKGE